MTEEEAIITTLSIRYGDDAEHQRATRYKDMTLHEVCSALNHEEPD